MTGTRILEAIVSSGIKWRVGCSSLVGKTVAEVCCWLEVDWLHICGNRFGGPVAVLKLFTGHSSSFCYT